jgi:hypothetical protein
VEDLLGLVTPQKPRTAAPTLPDAEAPGNTADIDLEQQLLGESAGSNSLPDDPLPGVPLADVPLPDVALSNLPLADVSLHDVSAPEARLDGPVG